MTLKEHLTNLNIDQIEDDEKFCQAEYEATRDYCESHSLTEDDIKEIELRGYQAYQFLEE